MDSNLEINRAQLKHTALAGLKGNWGFAVGAVLLTFVIFMGLIIFTSLIFNIFYGDVPTGPLCEFIINIIVTLISGFIGLCIPWVFLDFVRNKYPKATDAFKPFYTSRIYRNIQATFSVTILIGLWTLLFIIPGIIKRFSYSQTNYILKDHPELSAMEAITLSRKMMNGYKAKLLVLELSFMGWAILSSFTLGIGFIWLIPYIATTEALFYDNLKRAYELSQQNIGHVM